MDMKKIAVAVLAVMLILSLAACTSGEEPQKQSSTAQQCVTYSYTDYPLERNGIHLHLDCEPHQGKVCSLHVFLQLHHKALFQCLQGPLCNLLRMPTSASIY